MKNKHQLILAFVLLIAANTAGAQGILIPDPVDGRRPAITIRSHRVNVDVRDQVARTRVEQVFHNAAPGPLEATYLFPIPESASLGDFTMWVDGQKMSGEVVGADRARQIYTDIVRSMRDPGLLEYAGQDLFRARVFPVPAGGEVRVEVRYDQLLEFDVGMAEYRYPLKEHAGMNPQTGEFAFHAEIESAQDIKNVYCPNYDVDTQVERGLAAVSFEGPGDKLAGDMVVFFSVSPKDIGMNLVCHREGGADGYFMLFVSPGRIERPRQVIGKDIVFVVDRSGSMAGEKIDQARAALHFCLNNLNANDRFGVVTFATEVQQFEQRLVEAGSRQVDAALDFVRHIEARGGTDIDRALAAALDLFAGTRPRYVVFLTDGKPTVGTTEVGTILANVAKAGDTRLRLFAFGVGYDVNTRLLDRLSADNRGVVTYVEPEEDIEVKVSNFYSKVSQPVLADLAIDFGGVKVTDVYPQDLPDLFNGGQIVVTGRYRGSASTDITVTGSVDGGERAYEYPARFARSEDDFDFVPRIWASRKIAHLVEEIRENGEDRELVEEIIELSQRYGIVTPYTSYLIVEEGERVLLGRGGRMEAFDSAAPPAEVMSQAMRKPTGKNAVTMSRLVAEAKDDDTVGSVDSRLVRYVGAKTFYRDGDEWVDAEFTEGMDATELDFLGDEYFRMLVKYPEIGAFFSLGERVVFLIDGRAYRVVTP